MDKIRRAFSNADGSPRTGLIVTAVPVLGGSQVAMPETSMGKSGIYASSSEVAHGTYAIYVNGSDTGDTQVVEPGLHLRDYPNGSDTGAIDRSLSEFVRLTSFFVGDQPTATHANMASACALAALRGKRLLLDADVSTESAISVTGNLYLDLNGRTLSLGAPITASGRLTANCGRVITAAGKYLRGVNSQLFLGVDFTGGGDEQIAESASSHSVYLACPGISRTKFTGGGPNYDGPIVIGCDASGTADRLMLGSRADKDTGDDRLIELQTFVDRHISDVIANSQFLNMNMPSYLKLVQIPELALDGLVGGSFHGGALASFIADSADCEAIALVDGVFTAKKLNAHEVIRVAANGSYTPDGRVAYVHLDNGVCQLNNPVDPGLVHEVHFMAAFDAANLKITAKFGFTVFTERVINFTDNSTYGGKKSFFSFVWNPIVSAWYCSETVNIA